MFASLDANGWTIIIAAIFLGLGQIVQMVLTYLRERDKIERDITMAKKVEEAASTILKSNMDVAQVKADERGTVGDVKVAEIAKQAYEEHVATKETA